MKKYMFTFALSFLCLVTTLHAQFSKGTILLDGYVSFDNNKNTQEQNSSPGKQTFTTSSFNFRPSVGLFLRPDLVIGIGPGVIFSGNTTKYDDGNSVITTSRQKNTTYTVSLYVTKYYKLFDKLYATASFQISGGKGKSKDEENSSYSYSSNSYNATLRGGLTYLLSNRFAVSTSVASVGYSYLKSTSTSAVGETTNKISAFGTSFDLNSFNFSIQYFFRNKTE